MFRLTTNNPKINKNQELLGDRTLAAWVGSEGEYVFSTYHYSDLQGAGNANSV